MPGFGFGLASAFGRRGAAADASPAAFAVLDGSGGLFSVPLAATNGSGAGFAVTGNVLDSSGTSFNAS